MRLRSICLFLALAVCAPLAAQTPATAPTPEQLAERHRLEDERLRTDWGGLTRYRDANAALPAPASGEQRVVFMGNSITDSWARFFPARRPVCFRDLATWFIISPRRRSSRRRWRSWLTLRRD